MMRFMGFPIEGRAGGVKHTPCISGFCREEV